MKRCHSCVKVYGDWRTECPECGHSLVQIELAIEPAIEKQSNKNARKYRLLRRLLSFAQVVAILALILGLGRIGFEFAVRTVSDAVLQDIEIMEEEGRQSEVLEELNGYRMLIPFHTDLQAAWDTYAEPYRADAIQRASEAYESYGPLHALAVLEEAMAVLEEDAELQREWDMYDRSRPVSLLNWTVLDQGENLYVGPVDFDQFAQYWEEVSMDKASNQYDPSGVHYVSHIKKPAVEDRSVSYALNGESAWLSGIVYIPAIAQRCDFDWSVTAAVEIYGDDQLLYTLSIDQYDGLQYPFRVTIDGVQELKIVMTSGWRSETFDEGRYYPKLCLADLFVEKPLG